jgi:hypothetical protein
MRENLSSIWKIASGINQLKDEDLLRKKLRQTIQLAQG